MELPQDLIIKELTKSARTVHLKLSSNSENIFDNHIDIRSNAFVRDVFAHAKKYFNLKNDDYELFQLLTLMKDDDSTAEVNELERLNLNMPVKYLSSDSIWFEKKVFADVPQRNMAQTKENLRKIGSASSAEEGSFLNHVLAQTPCDFASHESIQITFYSDASNYQTARLCRERNTLVITVLKGDGTFKPEAMLELEGLAFLLEKETIHLSVGNRNIQIKCSNTNDLYEKLENWKRSYSK